MRGTSRNKTIAAAVAAGALVLGGSATALAAGQGWGSGAGNGAGNSAGNAANSTTSQPANAQADHEDCDGTHQRQGGQGGKGQGGKGGKGQGGQGSGHGETSNLELGELTAAQEAEMVFMAEEEKMAGDLYEAFYDMYGVRVFTNIASSEDKHTDAVRDLLDAYGVDDPTVGMAAGEFTIPEVQAMYDDLLEQGSVSVEAALAVGVTVEEVDIADLQDAVDGLDAPRAAAVYENLLAGSQNHLKAFSR
jgi:hypothetical protein